MITLDTPLDTLLDGSHGKDKLMLDADHPKPYSRQGHRVGNDGLRDMTRACGVSPANDAPARRNSS